jgi:hypothetical protein
MLTRQGNSNTMLPNHRIRNLSALLLIAVSSPAHAYIDPGTGSLIIQSIIGAIAAVGVTLKLYWHKLKVLVSKKKSIEKVQDTPTDK